MQENNAIRKAPTNSTASLNNEVETNLNEIRNTAKATEELTINIHKHKKRNHESCKGCDGICCSKKEKKHTD